MKVRLFFAPAVLAFALAACGQQAEAPSEAPPPAAAPPAAEAPAAAANEITPEMQATLASLPAPFNEGNLENGRKIFQQCRSCHTIEAGGRNMVGPNLHGVIGRPAASVEGFAYSDALKGSGITWDQQQIYEWLAGPNTFLPGNKMAFAGVPNTDNRRDVIAYISVMGATPAAPATP